MVDTCISFVGLGLSDEVRSTKPNRASSLPDYHMDTGLSSVFINFSTIFLFGVLEHSDILNFVIMKFFFFFLILI